MNAAGADARHDVGAAAALQVLASVLVVVLVTTVLVTSRIGERLACAIEAGVASVVDSDTQEDCEAPLATSTVDAAEEDVTARRDTSGSGTLQGLSAKLHSSGNNSRGPSPGSADALLAAAFPGDDCVTALTGTTEPSLVCLTPGDDGRLERCLAGPTSGSLDCRSPDTDPRPRLNTSASANLTAWCHPLTTPTGATAPGGDRGTGFRQAWACASWAGDVFFCDNDVPDVARYGRESGSEDWFGTGHPSFERPHSWELVGWHTNRTLWPRSCDDRAVTVRDWLECEPTSQASGHVRCTVRGFGSSPARTITCVEFAPSPATSTRLTALPMHCVTGVRAAATPSGAATIDDVARRCPDQAQPARRPLSAPAAVASPAHGRLWPLSFALCVGAVVDEQVIVVGGGAAHGGLPSPNALVSQAQITANGQPIPPFLPILGLPGAMVAGPPQPPAATLFQTLLAVEQAALMAPGTAGPPWFGDPVWITDLLPSGHHAHPEAAAGLQPFLVIHPDQVTDPGLVAQALLTQVPNPQGPGTNASTTVGLVDAVVTEAITAFVAHAVAQQVGLPTALAVPQGQSFPPVTASGLPSGAPAAHVAAVASLLNHLAASIQADPDLLANGPPAELVIDLLHDAGLVGTGARPPATYAELHRRIAAALNQVDLDPGLIDAAFRDLGGYPYLTATCRAPWAGPGSDDPGPSGSGGTGSSGGTGAAGGLAVSCP